MLFQNRRKWWGSDGERDAPHEGLDFLLYKDGQGRVRRLGQTTRIPSLYEGTVTAIINDFLGKSIIVAHSPDRKGVLVSIYGHTFPGVDIRPGKTLESDSVLGVLADTSGSKASVWPHLHLSLGWVSNLEAIRNLNWGNMHDPDLIELVDPLSVLDGAWQILPAEPGETL